MAPLCKIEMTFPRVLGVPGERAQLPRRKRTVVLGSLVGNCSQNHVYRLSKVQWVDQRMRLGIAGQPGGKSGPAPNSTASNDQRNPTTQLQDMSKIQVSPVARADRPLIHRPSSEATEHSHACLW
jgi:hypothetical protein